MLPRPLRSWILLTVSSVAWAASVFAQDARGRRPDRALEPELKPGTAVQLDAPESGSTVLVYVPQDYTPERPWPVIFCYHGARGDATTWPFRQVTDGKGFIVVGMNYQREEYYRTLPADQTGPEKEYFAEASAIVAKHLKTDRRMMFMGGFSQGGYSTSVLGEQLLEKLAGLILLGAGRRNLDRVPPARASLLRKPVFIGVGEQDELHNAHARRAAKNYRAWGATVTFEEWAGLGHQPDQNSETLREWLLDNGPRKVFKADLAAARKAEASGKLGAAYSLYCQLSRYSEVGEAAAEAETAAETLATRAEKELAAADVAVAEKQNAQALKQFKQIAKSYDGSIFGERAARRLEELQPGRPAR